MFFNKPLDVVQISLENSDLFLRKSCGVFGDNSKLIIPPNLNHLLVIQGIIVKPDSNTSSYEIKRGKFHYLDKKVAADYVNILLFSATYLSVKWGGNFFEKIADPETGNCFNVFAFGDVEIAIADAEGFYLKTAGANSHIQVNDIGLRLRGIIVSVLEEYVKTNRLSLENGISTREVGNAVLPILDEVLREGYGVTVSSINIEEIKFIPAK